MRASTVWLLRYLHRLSDYRRSRRSDQHLGYVLAFVAGAVNAGAEVGPDFPQVTRETLVGLKPDVLLVAMPDQPAQQPDDPRLATWKSLPIPAARNQRIYFITDPQILMGSLDIGRQTLDLARLIHPEIKQQLDNIPASMPEPASDQQSRERKEATAPAPAQGDARP